VNGAAPFLQRGGPYSITGWAKTKLSVLFCRSARGVVSIHLATTRPITSIEPRHTPMGNPVSYQLRMLIDERKVIRMKPDRKLVTKEIKGAHYDLGHAKKSLDKKAFK